MHPGPATYCLFFKLALSFSVACLVTSASAQLVNTTVDDTSGDPLTGATILYEPASSWKSGNLSVCANCTARPDAFHASGETWHEGLSLPSLPGEQSQGLTASLPFNGASESSHSRIHRVHHVPRIHSVLTLRICAVQGRQCTCTASSRRSGPRTSRSTWTARALGRSPWQQTRPAHTSTAYWCTLRRRSRSRSTL